MADNVTAKGNEGAGTEVFRARDVDGVLYPATMLADGAGNIAGSGPDHILNALVRLIDNIGVMSPDIAGRLRVVLDTGSSISTITTVSGVTTVTTVTTVGTVTNLAQVGGISANLLHQGVNLGNEADLRRNIVIS
jgi:hypothetical protein